MALSLVRASFVGLLGLGGVSALIVAWSSLIACTSLSETSPLPNGDASDIDTGYVPFPEDVAAPPPAQGVDTGAPPASGRIRLANFLQGIGNVDLCARVDPSGPWINQQISNPSSGTGKGDGLAFGEVSAHSFLNVPAPGAAGTRYQFRVIPLGGTCEAVDGGTAGPVLAVPATALRQGGGLTIVAMGLVPESGQDAGDSLARGVAQPDTLSPPATAALLRVFHGVPDLAAFDVVINGENFPSLTGIKYGNSLGFPYNSTNGGFQSIPAGVPEGATLTLRAGTSARDYIIPGRLRRGVATTIFVGGSFANDTLKVSLCSDRSPPEGDQVATCETLAPK